MDADEAVPAHHAPQKNEMKIDAEAAIMPTFVFVHAGKLHELAGAAARDVRPFAAFHCARRVPLITGRDVQSLRD